MAKPRPHPRPVGFWNVITRDRTKDDEEGKLETGSNDERNKPGCVDPIGRRRVNNGGDDHCSDHCHRNCAESECDDAENLTLDIGDL
ncbi:MAG TPA: hypothetical protein VGQ76_10425 [Thermoanaerobaculia bacterium]|nr:hypothetical protein [Thermoanaerobaculia bacterium]